MPTEMQLQNALSQFAGCPQNNGDYQNGPNNGRNGILVVPFVLSRADTTFPRVCLVEIIISPSKGHRNAPEMAVAKRTMDARYNAESE